MTGAAKQRLFLYILIGTLPEIINWLTLTFDMSPRGIAILAAKVTLTAAINWRAFIDGAGKTPPPVADVYPQQAATVKTDA